MNVSTLNHIKDVNTGLSFCLLMILKYSRSLGDAIEIFALSQSGVSTHL